MLRIYARFTTTFNTTFTQLTQHPGRSLSHLAPSASNEIKQALPEVIFSKNIGTVSFEAAGKSCIYAAVLSARNITDIDAMRAEKERIKPFTTVTLNY